MEISEELQKKLEACTKERDEYLNGWKRAKADFINYQKDEAKRFAEFAAAATDEVLLELVGVLDGFELAVAAMEKTGRDDKGIYMIKSHLEEILKKRGLEKIKFSLGEPFNPAWHEAIAEVKADFPVGTIAEEVVSGWRRHDKVIRASKVKISK